MCQCWKQRKYDLLPFCPPTQEQIMGVNLSIEDLKSCGLVGQSHWLKLFPLTIDDLIREIRVDVKSKKS